MRVSFLVSCLLLSAAVSLCEAQIDSSPVHPDSLLKEANRYLSRGATDSARTLFNVVLASGKSFATKAQLGLVQVDLAEQEWQEAGRRCDILLKDNPQDLAAQYYAGISRREWGARIGGPPAWGRSREHFEAVLARDSLHRDVLYQLALLKEYEQDLEEAIALAYRQVLLRPELQEAELGLFHLYRHYLSATDPEEALLWLGLQENEYSRYFAGEVLRRTGQWMAAETTFIELLRRPSQVPEQASYLSLAQMDATVNHLARAQNCYWKAVDGINSWLSAALIFEGLKHIITDRELDEYRALSSDRLKITFFHRFWQVRDPMPAAAINVRLIEHLQRYSQAEERFEYYGPRTHFSNPDRLRTLSLPKAFDLNKEFSDLGVIHLKHGVPNRIEQTMGNPPPPNTGNDPALKSSEEKEYYNDPLDTPNERATKAWGNANVFGPTAIDPHQAWIYIGTGDEPQRIFLFALHNTASQNWRLTPLPGGAGTFDREMLDILATYDPQFAKLKRARTPEVNKAIADLRREEELVVATALATDRHVWERGMKEFPVPHAIDAFRSPTGGTLLDISYAIPYGPLQEATESTIKKVQVEVGIAATSPAGTCVIHSQLDTLDVFLTPKTKGSYVGLFRQVLLADSVRLTSHVRALNAPAVGTWSEQLRVRSFAGKEFMVSDLQLLLPATSGPTIDIDGVKVQQSPFKNYSNLKPAYAYLQIYNLVKDMYGSAGFTARFTLAPLDRPGEATVLAEVKKDVTEDHRSEFQMLDINGISPGSYMLTATVTDRKRVQTISRTREIEITK